MIILLRRWNGTYPLWETTRSGLWFGNQEQSTPLIAAWVLSCSKLTWGYRSSVGYLGEWSLSNDSYSYQWRCWTSEAFAKQAYIDNSAVFAAEKNSRALSDQLGLVLEEVSTTITIDKDPAGLTAVELDAILGRKQDV